MHLDLPAPAKINWFLHVTGRRTDGYHELQTAFQCIDLADRIRLVRREDGVIARGAGLLGLAPEADLTVRAAQLLQQHTGSRWGVQIEVEKRIPAGGGLGGGSSDAATVLLGLNRLWGLHLPRTELQVLGLSLGADVPFFIFGRSAFAEGVGESLQPVALPEQPLLLLDPGVSVPTAEIFRAPELTRNTPRITIQGFSEAVRRGALGPDLCAPSMLGSAGLHNDLQAVAAGRYDQVRAALDWLVQCAPDSQVRMSGSGGCCFVVWPSAAPLPQPPVGMQLWRVRTLSQHPLAEKTESNA